MSKSQKSKKMATSKKPNKPNIAAAASVTDITLTNPNPNQLDWTAPPLGDDTHYVSVMIDFLTPDGTGGYIKPTGGLTRPIDSATPITSFTNGEPNWGGQGVIPTGTWSIRIDMWTAQLNPQRGQQNPDGTYQPTYIASSWTEHQSNILDGVTFS